MFQFEGLITSGNEALVHHMEVFHCEVPPGVAPPSYDAPCDSENKPQELDVCRKVIGAWAMGAPVRKLVKPVMVFDHHEIVHCLVIITSYFQQQM